MREVRIEIGKIKMKINRNRNDIFFATSQNLPGGHGGKGVCCGVTSPTSGLKRKPQHRDVWRSPA